MEPICHLHNIAMRIISFYGACKPIVPLCECFKFGVQNVLFLHDIYNSTLPSKVIFTFNVDFSHVYNTSANACVAPQEHGTIYFAVHTGTVPPVTNCNTSF